MLSHAVSYLLFLSIITQQAVPIKTIPSYFMPPPTPEPMPPLAYLPELGLLLEMALGLF